MTTPSWPGLDGGPALPYRASFQRKSVQLPFATNAVPTELDAPEVVWGTGDPNGAVLGSIGDFYVQQDDGKAVAMWSKSIGSSTTTGWFRLAASHWFDPLFYGAIGDDVTNDKAAVQSCFTAAGAVSGMVVFTKMHLCATKVLIPSNVTLVGAGWATGLHFTYTTATTNDVYLQNSDTTNGNTNITLRGFTVKGAWPNATPGGAPSPGLAAGILFRRGSNIELTQMQIQNVPSISVSHQGITNFRAIDNFVHDGGRDGITGGPYGTSPSVDVRIQCNTILDVHDDFIACNMSVDSGVPGTTPPARWTIMGNVCRGGPSLSADNFARGIMVSGGEDIGIIANSVSDTWQQTCFIFRDVVTLNQPKRIRVIGNQFRRAGRVGVSFTSGVGFQADGFDLKIVGNEIAESSSHGAQIGRGSGQGVDGCEFSDNTIRNCGDVSLGGIIVGLWLSGTSYADKNVMNLVVANNRIYGSAAMGVFARYADHLDLTSNKVYNNHQKTGLGTSGAGIVVDGCGVARVHGNSSYDTQGTKTQTYAFATQNSAGAIGYLSLKDNYFPVNLTDSIIFNVTMPTVLHIRLEDKQQSNGAVTGSPVPDPRLGETFIWTLAGNITVGDAPALGRIRGVRMTFVFIQDGTGGRTVAWAAAYKVTWADAGNTLGKRSSVSFEYDGTNWCQIAPQTTYV